MNICVRQTTSFIQEAEDFTERKKKERKPLIQLAKYCRQQNILESERFPKFLSDCNTRQTSIAQAERSESMTGCREKRDISGSSTRDTLASVLKMKPCCRVQARSSRSTSTRVFVQVDSCITESLCGLEDSCWQPSVSPNNLTVNGPS